MADSKELLTNPPCFRSGLLWGLSTGALIGAHRFRTTKRVRTACDWAVLAFGTVAAGSWLVCRTTYVTRVQQTRQFMEVMNNPEKKAEAEQFLRSRVVVDATSSTASANATNDNNNSNSTSA